MLLHLLINASSEGSTAISEYFSASSEGYSTIGKVSTTGTAVAMLVRKALGLLQVILLLLQRIAIPIQGSSAGSTDSNAHSRNPSDIPNGSGVSPKNCSCTSEGSTISLENTVPTS